MGPASLFTLALSIFFFMTNVVTEAHAATVRAARTDRAMLQLENDEVANVGNVVTIKDSHGQEKAIGVVTAVKGRRAMIRIRSGEVNPGDKASVKTDRTNSSKETGYMSPTRPYRWNVFGGLSSDTQTVRLSSAMTANLNGFSPLIRGSLSGSLRRDTEWEAGTTFEYFQTRGSIPTNACRSSSDCHVEMLNLTPFGRIGWRPFGERFLATQVRGGVDAVVPIVVSSNIVDTNPFNPLILVVGGWAGQLRLSEGARLPIALEVGWHFGNVDATLLRMMALVGYSW